MNFIIPENILTIITEINNAGYKAHIVGGCLRDFLLNMEPTDWDITTNASPNTIKCLFKKTFDTGLKHGTITVLYNKTVAEVTSWRKDSVYSDHRRPDYVTPSDSLLEDLSRRDFTINAMAYHPDDGLLDPFHGLSDLKNNIIRCVGSPLTRFSEDALRMLRAIRFAAQLGFTIEAETLSAISKQAYDIRHISKERVQAEINKILQSNNPDKLKLIWKTNINKIIFPQIGILPRSWEKAVKYFIGSEYQNQILLGLLFYTSCDIDALQHARDYLNNHKYDNKTKKSVSMHIKCLDAIKPITPRNTRKNAAEYGVSITNNAIRMLYVLGQLSPSELKSYNNTIEQDIPTELNISGNHLLAIGLRDRNIGNMLNLLLLCIYERPELNKKDILIGLVKIINSIKYTKKSAAKI